MVDDEPEVRASLSMLLKSMQFRPQPWTSGNEFLAGIETSPPGCVLLDLHMPGLDGLAVQKRMDAVRATFPVVMVSGHGDLPTAIEALRGGARDFLSKPFTRIQLQRSLIEAQNWVGDENRQSQMRSRARHKLDSLDRREIAILGLMSKGQTERMIAVALDISIDDVDLCRETVYVKLEVDRTALAVRTLLDAA